ncbi:aldolase, partial [Paenibacillus thailandensis]
IALPEGFELQNTNAPIDVDIELNHRSCEFEASGEPAGFEAADGEMRFRVPETALYRIAGGSRVEVTPWPGAEEARIRLYLLGSCMGALLMQRGILPLHGSAVVIEGKAYAIVGQSGAGKSTLAAAFASAGYPLVTDDVIAVSVSHAQEASKVYPSYPQQKLWEESIEQLGLASGEYLSVYQRVNKYAVPVRSRFHLEPLPLAGVIELSEFSEPEPEIRSCTALEALHVLNVHTYRNSLVPLLQLNEWHFQSIARLASQLPVYQLRRPANGFTAFSLVNQIVSLSLGR